MVTKRDLFITLLAGFCLITTILMVRSSIGDSPKDTTTNVYVTNFPTQELDPAWKLALVAENFNVTWETDPYGSTTTDSVYLDPVCLGGYNRMRLYVQVTNYSSVAGSTPHEINRAKIRVRTYEQFGEERTGRFLSFFKKIHQITDVMCFREVHAQFR